MRPNDLPSTYKIGAVVLVAVVVVSTIALTGGFGDAPRAGGPEADPDAGKGGDDATPESEGTNATDSPDGADLVELVVDRSITPQRSSLSRLDDDTRPRPVARVVDSDGIGSDFVADELVFEGTREEAQALADRYSGEIRDAYNPDRIAQANTPSDDHESTGPDDEPIEEGVFLVGLDVDQIEPDMLESDLADLGATGETYRVSDPDGLRVLAAAFNATAMGADVNANWVAEPEFANNSSVEGAGRDVWDWPEYNEDDDPPIGVTEAWAMLAGADKLPNPHNRHRVAVIDSGFAPHDDLPEDTVAVKGYMGPRGDKPYHGTYAASSAVGVANNSFGVAGTAGPVATPVLVETELDDFDVARDVLTAYYRYDADIITMSFGFKRLGLSETFTLKHQTTAIRRVVDDGGLVFTSAGNKGTNVDETRVAREKRDWMPCEIKGVICVGGTDSGSNWYRRHPSSNYGTSTGENTVDIFAPYRLPVGPILDDSRTLTAHGQKLSGTSFSGPYVAGVAALIKSANPSLTSEEVTTVLIETAMDSPDPEVDGIVDAEAAVERAITGEPPIIHDISAPESGKSIPRGTSIRLSASISDPENALETVEWVSSRDGVLLEEESGRVVLESYGEHELHFRAVDWGGQEVISEPIRIDSTNQPPQPEIVRPSDGAVYLVNEWIDLEGHAIDPNEFEEPLDPERGGYRLTGDALEWFNTKEDHESRVGTGEESGTAIFEPDTYEIVLRATDGAGEVVETSVEIEVVPQGEPVVRITDPGGTTLVADEYDNTTNEYYVNVTLTGEGSDSTGDPLTGDQLTWTSTHIETIECEGGVGGICFVPIEETIGTGESTTARLTIPQGEIEETYTISLVGEDGAETVSDSIQITVEFRPD